VRPSRNVLIVGFLIMSTTFGVAACGSDDEVERDRFDSGSTPAAVPYDLPFGLEEVEGSAAVGRPAVYEVPGGGDRPEPSTVLHAAYRVEADDPVEVFEGWVTELEQSTLGFGQIHVRADGGDDDDDDDDDDGAWLAAANVDGNYLDLQLWTTEGDPILLVHVIGDEEGSATLAADEVEAGEPPSSSLAWDERQSGDTLFREGDTIHVPENSSTLTPTVPISQGTGGSYSVLSADDGAAAVDAMLAEAQTTSDSGEVDEPTRYEHDGTTVITAGFVIPAGGWGFDVVSVQGPDDQQATVYVSSAAD
jgi:hypothetical protein